MSEAMRVPKADTQVPATSNGVRVERLCNTDRARLAAHFLALSPKRLADRFGAVIRDGIERGYVAQLDLDRDIVVALSEADGTILATAQVSSPTRDAHWAELCFTALPGETESHACERAIAVAVAQARQANLALLVVNGPGFDSQTRALLGRVGFDLVIHEGGITGEMALRDPNDGG